MLTDRLDVGLSPVGVAVAKAGVGDLIERVIDDVLELVRQRIAPPAMQVILVDEDEPAPVGEATEAREVAG